MLFLLINNTQLSYRATTYSLSFMINSRTI